MDVPATECNSNVEECQSTPALLEVTQPQVSSSSLGIITEHSLLESCTRLSISLEQNGLFKAGNNTSHSSSGSHSSRTSQNHSGPKMTLDELKEVNKYAESTKSLTYLPQVHERQTERMKTRSQWFLAPSVDCCSCGGSVDMLLGDLDVKTLTSALMRKSSSGTIDKNKQDKNINFGKCVNEEQLSILCTCDHALPQNEIYSEQKTNISSKQSPDELKQVVDSLEIREESKISSANHNIALIAPEENELGASSNHRGGRMLRYAKPGRSEDSFDDGTLRQRKKESGKRWTEDKLMSYCSNIDDIAKYFVEIPAKSSSNDESTGIKINNEKVEENRLLSQQNGSNYSHKSEVSLDLISIAKDNSAKRTHRNSSDNRKVEKQCYKKKISGNNLKDDKCFSEHQDEKVGSNHDDTSIEKETESGKPKDNVDRSQRNETKKRWTNKLGTLCSRIEKSFEDTKAKSFKNFERSNNLDGNQSFSKKNGSKYKLNSEQKTDCLQTESRRSGDNLDSISISKDETSERKQEKSNNYFQNIGKHSGEISKKNSSDIRRIEKQCYKKKIFENSLKDDKCFSEHEDEIVGSNHDDLNEEKEIESGKPEDNVDRFSSRRNKTKKRWTNKLGTLCSKIEKSFEETPKSFTNFERSNTCNNKEKINKSISIEKYSVFGQEERGSNCENTIEENQSFSQENGSKYNSTSEQKTDCLQTEIRKSEDNLDLISISKDETRERTQEKSNKHPGEQAKRNSSDNRRIEKHCYEKKMFGNDLGDHKCFSEQDDEKFGSNHENMMKEHKSKSGKPEDSIEQLSSQRNKTRKRWTKKLGSICSKIEKSVEETPRKSFANFERSDTHNNREKINRAILGENSCFSKQEEIPNYEKSEEEQKHFLAKSCSNETNLNSSYVLDFQGEPEKQKENMSPSVKDICRNFEQRCVESHANIMRTETLVYKKRFPRVNSENKTRSGNLTPSQDRMINWLNGKDRVAERRNLFGPQDRKTKSQENLNKILTDRRSRIAKVLEDFEENMRRNSLEREKLGIWGSVKENDTVIPEEESKKREENLLTHNETEDDEGILWIRDELNSRYIITVNLDPAVQNALKLIKKHMIYRNRDRSDECAERNNEKGSFPQNSENKESKENLPLSSNRSGNKSTIEQQIINSFKNRERKVSNSKSGSFKMKYGNISRSCSLKNKAELCSCPSNNNEVPQLNEEPKSTELPSTAKKTTETICITLTYKPRI